MCLLLGRAVPPPRRGAAPERLTAAGELSLAEAAAQSLLHGADEHLLSFTATVVVLACLTGAVLMVLGLGVSIIIFISIIRTVSLGSLREVWTDWKPFLAYSVGVPGVLLARYADRLRPVSRRYGTGCCKSVVGAKEEDIPVCRKRGAVSGVSSDMAQSLSSKPHRSSSLPCMAKDQVGCPLTVR